MSLRIYNTLTGQKEDFEPINPGKVTMYVCGVTVYDLCHIGHARSQVVFDAIARYIEHLGYELNYVRNFTDVDDKIIKRAGERGKESSEIANEFIAEFYTDMDALGIRRPSLEPKATEHIGQMIDVIQKLVDKGIAYPAEGDVYFSTRKFDGYGKLSKRNLDDMIAGERIKVDPRKKDPLDFVLWKAAKPGEPSWDSPWGQGRPGWHIECSAMSHEYLGQPIDIHGGGKDLIFPHHENEIAQSEAAYGKPFVRYWMHNGFVQFNQEKMAKSTGNFQTIRDILDRYTPEALRFFLLSAHYRSPIEFAEQSLIEAQSAVDRLYDAQEALRQADFNETAMDEGALNDAQKELAKQIQNAADEFTASMDDDFNTAKAGGHFFEIARATQIAAKEEPYQAAPGRDMLLTLLSSKFEMMNKVLGVLINDAKSYNDAKVARSLGDKLSPQDIEALIEKRNASRAAKDWAAADAIRDELASKGIIIKDSPEGTTWTV